MSFDTEYRMYEATMGVLMCEWIISNLHGRDGHILLGTYEPCAGCL